MRQKRTRRLVLAAVVLAAAVLLLNGALQRLEKQLYPQRYAAYVEAGAQEYGLDPLLIYAFIRTESGFVPQAESEVGARGLMQITQETYEWIHSKLSPQTTPDFDEMYDPQQNIRYGCYYVAACLQRYDGDVATAAAAYHSGWGTVDGLLQTADGERTLTEFPYTNMNRYVKKIRRNYERYRSLYDGG